jgi:hypothetical protein
MAGFGRQDIAVHAHELAGRRSTYVMREAAREPAAQLLHEAIDE